MAKLTKGEEKAISDLKALAKRWPNTLWLFANGGPLAVLKLNADGERATRPDLGGAMDPAYVVASVNIPNDGGDW